MTPPSTSISLKWARRRYLADRRGSTAIEFAIVAPIFLALMFSTFELGWFYFVNSSVDAAATNAARILRTGQADSVSKGEFFHLVVCPKVKFLGNCASRLTVEVKKFDNFAALTAASNEPFVCRDASESDIDNIKYDPSEELAIYRVRLCYLYDTLNPTIGMSLAENDLGQKKVTATYILRAEPYATSSSADEE
jgi:Flp pilus assembly pilin Flp